MNKRGEFNSVDVCKYLLDKNPDVNESLSWNIRAGLQRMENMIAQIRTHMIVTENAMNGVEGYSFPGSMATMAEDYGILCSKINAWAEMADQINKANGATYEF